MEIFWKANFTAGLIYDLTVLMWTEIGAITTSTFEASISVGLITSVMSLEMDPRDPLHFQFAPTINFLVLLSIWLLYDVILRFNNNINLN